MEEYLLNVEIILVGLDIKNFIEKVKIISRKIVIVLYFKVKFYLFIYFIKFIIS